MVKVAGSPAAGGAVPTNAIDAVGWAMSDTVTEPCVFEPVCVPPPPVVPPLDPLDEPAPTVAVTVAGWNVVKTVSATPFASVVTVGADSVPAVVANVTGAALSAFPLMSTTFAAMVLAPPVAGSDVGLADTFTRPTAAAPTAILSVRSPPDAVPPVVPVVPVPPVPLEVVAPPEAAPIVAIPLAVPARNETVTRPLTSVLASTGSMVPNVVVKVTLVPLCGGVPDDSRTCAIIVATPLIGRAVAAEVKVIVEPVGANSGTFSHPTARSGAVVMRRRPQKRCSVRGIIVTITS
jgi:hypothetical protein